MKITKKRDGDRWRICFDGKPSAFTIGKGDAPRYREPQMYWVEVQADGEPYPEALFECNGVARCMSCVEMIANAVAKAEG